MKRIPFLIIILNCFFSCSQPQNKSFYGSYQELIDAFESLAYEPNTTWDEVVSFADVFTDTLATRANDIEDLSNRIVAQENGYMLISFITDKYEELKSSGKEVNYDDVTRILDKIVEIESIWFYDDDDQLPHIWRDHYYVSHQDTECEVPGYFHIMVSLPCEMLPEPTLRVFYPDSAEGDPFIIFGKYLSGETVEEDPEQRKIVIPDTWAKKDEIEDGFPMYVELGSDAVKEMLSFDVVYLMFQSGVSPAGESGQTEIARLSLNSFQAKWKEVSQSKEVE